MSDEKMIKFPGWGRDTIPKSDAEMEKQIKEYEKRLIEGLGDVLKKVQEATNRKINLPRNPNRERKWEFNSLIGPLELTEENGTNWLIKWYYDDDLFTFILIDFSWEMVYVKDEAMGKAMGIEEFKEGYYTRLWLDYLGPDYEKAKERFCELLFGSVHHFTRYIGSTGRFKK